MIPDSRTNLLYLADTLPKKYPDFFQRFEKTLNNCNIDFKLLPGTKDIWAVDYMPIQIDEKNFVRFVYNPSYLQFKKYLKTISDVDAICENIGLQIIKSDIVLEGGNVVRTTDKVIITDRIFIDNPKSDRKKLLRELHELLQVDKIFLVPEQPGDFTGHADGMVRFVDDETVIINDFTKENKNFRRAFEIAIHNTGLNFHTIRYNPYLNKTNTQANGDYINYLQMQNVIIAPTFGIEEDEQVVIQLKAIFNGYKVVTIEANEIAAEGGILNCISWNILNNNLWN